MTATDRPRARGEGPGPRFAREIREALEKGIAPSDLVLHLTLSDASSVKRDPLVGLDDVSFSSGGMCYLGVDVLQGGVRLSELQMAGASPPPSEPGEVEMAKGQKKSNKEVRKPKAEKAKPPPVGRTFTTPPGSGKS